MAELESLDECGWERASLTDAVTGAKYGQQGGLTASLNFSSERHAIRAAAIRYFIATGKTPSDFYEINNLVGTQFNGFMRSLHENDYLPKSIIAAREAGLRFAGVAA